LKKRVLLPPLGLLLAIGLWMIITGGRMLSSSLESWSQPLGPELGMETEVPKQALIMSPGVLPIGQASRSSMETVSPSPFAPLPTSDAPQPLCGGPEMMTILGIGTDNRADTYRYGLADVIRVARVDFVTPRITVLSLPRDIWVRIPSIQEKSGITHGKLNQAFFYGGDGWGYYNGPAGGAGLTARTLNKNFGLFVDHYGVVNMVTFERIVDALGGVDVNLSEPVDGSPIDAFTDDMGYFAAGEHHFNGDQALRFSRIRKRYNDIRRADNQNVVLCALRKKIVSPSIITALPQIFAAFQDSVQTDLSLEQLSQLACLAPKIKKKNIIFTGLPGDMLEETWEYSPQLGGTTFTYSVDEEAVTQLLADFQAGTWPTKPNEPSCQ
jgi:polyisoprenyl-teichoic acid--peptidoglycan teichoic acid transferase